MTVPVPRWATHRRTFKLWWARYRFRGWLHGRRRNPDCNERRRFRDDTKFVAGEHRHIEPITVDGIQFERVAVPVRPFRFSGPTLPDGIVARRTPPEECCDQAYCCPSSGEMECLVHGGFDVCCDHPACPGRPKAQSPEMRTE